MQNTIYIAEPIFSEKLQKFDGEASFPPIKKIGVTTDLPDRREKELLGTKSPVKISIVKAWTSLNARKVESMLHTILDNRAYAFNERSCRA
ncbi:GIY-YIG nuclease family protein [Vreelandella sulfidaeris]|uniref:GIY-YIG nuclease family protein n=1 Tax=Vreelandella sulfidaeris TaxID=115553 RepID=UPI0035F00978